MPVSVPFSPPEAPPIAPGAALVARGIMRMFARNGIWCLGEMPLRGGRRADLMGIDAKGQVVIVEIKVVRADLVNDAKWTDYLDHCDRFYWGLCAELDSAHVPSDAFQGGRCGLIFADGYDAEIVRAAATVPLAAARRKVEVERLARAALRRHSLIADPVLASWGE